MRATVATLALAGSVAAFPFKANLPNGFPNPNADALKAIEKQAHGTLPNTALPSKLSATTLTDFQVIANQELFEVAYFTSLLQNVTDGVKGYEIPNKAAKDELIAALTAVQAQEELHAIGANAILTTAHGVAIKPCEYQFGVTDLVSALRLAYTFTDVVEGALQDVQNDLASDGDAELIPLIGAIIGQEGEQNGFYRSSLGNVPSALPFLTRSAGLLAWSALNQNFIIKDSCPNPPAIPVLDTLTVTTQHVAAQNQKLTFNWVRTGSTNCEEVSLVYINQQNKPIVVKPTVIAENGQNVQLEAEFPYEDNLLNSLTQVALTKSAGPFASVPDVAKDAVAGPALIEVL